MAVQMTALNYDQATTDHDDESCVAVVTGCTLVLENKMETMMIMMI